MRNIHLFLLLLIILVSLPTVSSAVQLQNGVTNGTDGYVYISAGNQTMVSTSSGISVSALTKVDNTLIGPAGLMSNNLLRWTTSNASFIFSYDGNALKENITLPSRHNISYVLNIPANEELIPLGNGDWKVVSTISGDTISGIIIQKPYGIDNAGRYVEMWYTWDGTELKLNDNGYTYRENATSGSVEQVTITYPLNIDPTWVSVSGHYLAFIGNETVEMWNATGIGTFVATGNITSTTSVMYVVVAGGGGGGYLLGGGGGGAGQYKAANITGLTGTISLSVGSGGDASTASSANGVNGQNSTFLNGTTSNITSIGGSGGGTRAVLVVKGGSTGGGGAPVPAGNTTTNMTVSQESYGRTGGWGSNLTSTDYNGGGGGGFIRNGSNGTTAKGGDGGMGTKTTITGDTIVLSGGGGGGMYSSTAGGRGAGGNNTSVIVGGSGAYSTNAATAANASSGSGGGGGGSTGTPSAGAGGIVIIRYASHPLTTFTSNVTSGNPPTAVQFNVTSTNTSTSWNWSFQNVTGNNTQVWFSTVQNVTYTFGIGNWSIKLNATNGADSNISSQITYINVSAAPTNPIASFTSNVTSGNIPLPVQFNDTSTNTPTTWNWSYWSLNMLRPDDANGAEDGNAKNGNNTYTILVNGTVVASTDYAWQGTYSAKIVTNNTAAYEGALIGIGMTSPLDMRLTNGTTRTGSVYVRGTGTVILSIDAYDSGWGYIGEVDSSEYTLGASWQRINVTYTLPAGTRIITLQLMTSTKQAATIYADGWQLQLGSSSTPWQSPYPISTTADPPSYFSSSQNATYTFSQAANYTIILNATNGAGSNITPMGKYWINTTSAGGSAPVATFTSNVTSGTAPLPVQFNDTSTNTPTGWNWSFQNVTGNNTQVWFSTVQNVSYTFGVGNWSIHLNASNAIGSSISAQVTYINVTAAGAAPVATFTSNVTSGTASLPVQFNDTSTNTPTGWNWSFQNVTGNNTQVWFSTVQNVSYTFGIGNWSIKLNASNAAGSSISTQVTYINVTAAGAALVANFNQNVTTGTAPTDVLFTDTSTGSPTGWSWLFGDENWTTDPWVTASSSSGWIKRSAGATVALPDGSVLMMGGASSGGTPAFNDTWRSTDNGSTWTRVNASGGWLPRYGLMAVTLTDGSVVLTGGINDGSSVYFNDTWRSTNQGSTWTRMNASSGWAARYWQRVVAMGDGSVVLLGGYNGVGGYYNDTWRSTDQGATWVRQSASSGWQPRYRFGSVTLSDDSIVIFGGLGSRNYNDTWQSKNYGNTWTNITGNPGPGWTARYSQTGIVMQDNSILAISGFDGTNYYKDVWRSTNNGSTWTSINSSIHPYGFVYSSGAVTTDGTIILTNVYDSSAGDTNITYRFNPSGSTLQNPTHTYSSVGNYSIVLLAHNSASYSDTTPGTHWVNVTSGGGGTAPIVSFTLNRVYTRIPSPIIGTDGSSCSPACTLWNWSWGDGTYSTTQSPTHIYLERGKFLITLNITNSVGSNTSTAQTVRATGYEIYA